MYQESTRKALGNYEKKQEVFKKNYGKIPKKNTKKVLVKYIGRIEYVLGKHLEMTR